MSCPSRFLTEPFGLPRPRAGVVEAVSLETAVDGPLGLGTARVLTGLNNVLGSPRGVKSEMTGPSRSSSVTLTSLNESQCPGDLVNTTAIFV